jgi:RNA polymerase sigma-70 factor (ECF subfamily)
MTRSRTEPAAETLVRSLFQDHGAAATAYAARLTGDRAAAEDLVQEALMRAWRHADRLVSSGGSVRGWLFTVVRNLVYDRSKARCLRPVEVGELQPDTAVSRDHSDQVIDSLLVLDAMGTLSAKHRSVLELVYFRGNTVAEAAAELGVPQGTVKSRTFQAIRLLRDVMPDKASLAAAS